jgi:hypothetical protein
MFHASNASGPQHVWRLALADHPYLRVSGDGRRASTFSYCKQNLMTQSEMLRKMLSEFLNRETAAYGLAAERPKIIFVGNTAAPIPLPKPV